MVKSVRIYFEGGGTASARAMLRKGLKEFLRDQEEKAREKGISIDVIVCGSRDSTIRDFDRGRTDHPRALNIVLVDSDQELSCSRLEFLRNAGFTQQLIKVANDDCHLMVQVMESWFIADRDALKRFYGEGFKINTVPRSSNIEVVEKDRVLRILSEATRNSRKGSYHKIQHGAKLLELVDSGKVRSVSKHCDEFLGRLEVLYS